MSLKILIVEDDKKIVKFLTQGFREEGYAVMSAGDGQTGLELAVDEDFDVIILDLMLPQKGGLDVCKDLRKAGRATPVIMLTARDAVENRVAGLDAGADDYLVKPFAFDELLARIRALDRRQRPDDQKTLGSGDLSMDLVARAVSFKGKAVDLTSREFNLLQLFLRRKGQVLSRTVIAEAVWGYDFDSDTNVIDVYVNYLRKKLRTLTGADWIETRRGQGYSFNEDAA